MKKIVANGFLFVLLFIIMIMLLCGCASNHVHSFGEWTMVETPTCTENGLEERFCSCGEKQEKIVAPLGHTEEWLVSTQPTCVEKGIKLRVCSVCGETIATVEIPAQGHINGEWIVDKESTCAEKGHKYQVCSVCGMTLQSLDVSLKEHCESDWIIEKEATCGENGLKNKVCLICGTTIESQVILQTGQHSWSSEKVIVSPTCLNDGSETVVCVVCGAEKTQVLQALGHELDATGKCMVCGRQDLQMNADLIKKAKTVKKMSHSVSEYSEKCNISIVFKDDEDYNVAVPTYVSVRIEDRKGNVVFKDIYVKSKSTNSISIDYTLITPLESNEGTLYYTVYSDYFTFEECSYSLTKLPWEANVALPDVPLNVHAIDYLEMIEASYTIYSIDYYVSGDTLTFTVTGEKIYDQEGQDYNRSCIFRWKLYDIDGYVIDDGCFWGSQLKVGDKFKNQEMATIYHIEPGVDYYLEIYDY